MKKTILALAMLFALAPCFSQQEYRYEVTDTITNAESDTINIPGIFRAVWYYNITTTITSLSGSQSITTALEETNDYPGSENVAWYANEDTGAFTTDGGTSRLHGTSGDNALDGLGARVIVTGGGTQSTIYRLVFTAKRE